MNFGWKSVTTLLCFYGFLKELRPSEPFLTEYLIDTRWVNITLQQAYYDVYPVWTYSYMAILIFVFLVTDLARYKPIIVLEGFAYIATWCLLIWGYGVALMQLMQVVYGLVSATEIAYYTYIYAKVDPKHFQKVTSFTRVAILCGRFLSGVLAQLLTSYGIMNYRELNYFSLVSLSLATLIAFSLPRVEKTQYFYKEYSKTGSDSSIEDRISSKKSFIQVFYDLKSDLSSSYKNGYVLRWSLWWALAMCGNFQVGNYIQPLWETIHPVQNGAIYNGGVEAFTTLVGAFLVFLLGFIHLNWAIIGEPVLFLLSTGNGCLLIFMGLTHNIWVAYGGYLAFRSLYQMLITVASYEIAQNIKETSYGLVFGVNTFLALFFQSILTLIVADDLGLALPPRTQFVIYGGFWCFIGIIFLLSYGISLSSKDGFAEYCHKIRIQGIWQNPSSSFDPSNINGVERRQVPVGSTEQL